jgi:endoglucanase
MSTKKLGAQTVAFAHPPCIVGHGNVVGKKEGEGPLADTFDYIDADDTFGQSGVCRQGKLGNGVQIRLYDPTNITPPALADFVLDVAAKNGITHQPTVRRTGGTDAAASYPNWQGTPAIVFGVPTRYIHSHNGIIDDRDLCACCDLVCAIVRKVAAQQLKAEDFVS